VLDFKQYFSLLKVSCINKLFVLQRRNYSLYNIDLFEQHATIAASSRTTGCHNETFLFYFLQKQAQK